MPNVIKLLISLAVPLLIGYAGSVYTMESLSTWYVTLNKPSFNPPDWIFGPVWTTLYVLMGISFFLVWKKNIRTPFPYLIFTAQLVLNFLWSYLFFGLRDPLLGLAGIGLLLVLIIINITVFYKISRAAAYLLIPYLVWVAFASILNCYIYILN